ncbi:DNA-processing protein DprA [soil metagenome]
MAPLTERDAWLILASTDRVGGETVAALLADFGTARQVLAAASYGRLGAWSARRARQTGLPQLSGRVLAALKAWPEAGPSRLRQLTELGLWAVTPLDADYPAGLRDLDPPPPFLVGMGERRLLSSGRPVAVVGTRRPTANGRWLTARICARLAECRALVVSGGAVGIDGAAHAATLDHGGQTLAVIGGGHLHPGPRAHAALRQRIVDKGGAIISEYTPQISPSKGTYPRRNRIIAALARQVIVVEAPARSGALITARDALELGRPVFVAPGRVGDWSTAGSLALLRDSPAQILAGVDELTEDLGFLGAPPGAEDADAPPAGQPGAGRRAAALGLLDGAQRTVAEQICRAPAGLDSLVEQTGLAPAVVSGSVTLLLIRGWLQPIGPAYLPAGPLLE